MKKPLCGCLSRSRDEEVQIACKTPRRALLFLRAGKVGGADAPAVPMFAPVWRKMGLCGAGLPCASTSGAGRDRPERSGTERNGGRNGGVPDGDGTERDGVSVRRVACLRARPLRLVGAWFVFGRRPLRLVDAWLAFGRRPLRLVDAWLAFGRRPLCSAGAIKKGGRESSRLPAVPEGCPSENY